MARLRIEEFHFKPAESGLLVPIGTTGSVREHSSHTYLNIKEKAQQVEVLYRRNGLKINMTSDLGRLIGLAVDLSDAWFLNRMNDVSDETLFNVCYFEKIASSLLEAQEEPNIKEYLQKLSGSVLDPFLREHSTAKDAAWELELFSSLKRRGILVSLQEPDIVATYGEKRIAIACKKLYSSNHVQSIASNANKQIRESSAPGIIALNIDNLIAPEVHRNSSTFDEVGGYLNSFNMDFLRSNERHIRKYLETRGLLAALVSTSTIAIVPGERQSLNYARETLIWHIPGISTAQSDDFRLLLSSFA
ncbi:MAG: hypothetical protein H6993_06505 [Pseudomonadales bacterium]|nr:hypothetical protein [Pseudomonadales bacterium]